ncbi:zinc finger protein 169 [Vairimorpha apis BRL 01]|uniref:Zinc finger protein 169 n=1 Tax=Vairimorpha apis BRL 01 TaxID=1037528 RepID=T0L253_9MICR|nr:zinc finger protein 169 [Vairimorpha apis BRL 01]
MECKWENCTEKVDDMYTHIKQHLKDQSHFKCLWNNCTKSTGFTSKGALYSHCKSHTTDKNWGCHICKLDFNSMSVYYRHKKKHQTLNEKEIKLIERIGLMSNLIQFYQNKNLDLQNDIFIKRNRLKFINNEIVEIIRKYVKMNNRYSNMKFWNDYL